MPATITIRNNVPAACLDAIRDLLDSHKADYNIDDGTKIPMPPQPDKCLFGFDDPFGDGGVYVWIVFEKFFREEGYADDSSTASSVIPPSEREGLDDEEADQRMDAASEWLRRASEGILYGEGMESCWDTGFVTQGDADRFEGMGIVHGNPYPGLSRDEAIEKIRAALEARGFTHEPKLDQEEDPA